MYHCIVYDEENLKTVRQLKIIIKYGIAWHVVDGFSVRKI